MGTSTASEGFAGVGVAAFESRRAAEIERLIEHAGGRPLVGPTMREAPIGDNPDAAAFGEALLSGQVDVHVCLTGVGTRMLLEVLESRWSRGRIVEALARAAVVVRGPKPTRVLNEWGVPITLRAPEPNTWREVVAELDRQADLAPLDGRRVWVQEYGAPNEALLAALRSRGADVRTVRVYRWALPEDIAPLERVLRSVAAGDAAVALFTNAQQVAHMLEVSRRRGLEDAVGAALGRMVVGSIGPTCTESLEAHELRVDFEPSHPRMGLLVSEVAAQWRDLRANRR